MTSHLFGLKVELACCFSVSDPPGCAYETQADLLPIDGDEFSNEVLPSCGSNDLIVFLTTDEDETSGGLSSSLADKMKQAVRSRGTHLVTVEASHRGPTSGATVLRYSAEMHICLPLRRVSPDPWLPRMGSLAELALKLVANCLTTGAHARIGKVYGSRMIDVSLTNDKLFRRACDIVAQIARVDESEATACILKAIHGMCVD